MDDKDEFEKYLRLGVIGHVSLCVVCTPLDVARRSIQAGIAARKAPPTLRQALAAAASRGVAQGLGRGIVSSVGQAAVAPGLWLVAYHSLRRRREAVESAAIATVVQTVMLQPVAFVRSCRQSGLLLASGAGAHLDRTVGQVIWSDGGASFWRALPAVLLRDVSVSVIFWRTYIALKAEVESRTGDSYSYQKYAPLASASAVVASLATQPLDVVKTRMQAHQLVRSGEDGYRMMKHARFFATIQEVWKAAGLRGLWAGALPRAARGALGGLLLGPLFHYAHLVAEDSQRPVRQQLYLPPDPSRTIVHPRATKAMFIEVK